MKLSIVIKRLTDTLVVHGDMEVLSDSADGCLPIEIGDVREVVDDAGRESKALLLWGLETVTLDD